VRRESLGDRVRFLGQLPHAALLAMYARGEVGMVALASVDLGGGLHEGIPVSLMEAMAYGLPVVSTRTGGIPELIREGKGMLVPPADPAPLAGALEALIASAPLRSSLGAAGRERVSQAFCARAAAGELARRIRGAP
jgi:glycosyltransferase involved in cell wall biosynthesis